MMRAVGSTLSRVDVVDKVAGVAQYPGDIDLPGQLWMKVVFAGIPHAQINTLNVDHARAAPGVVAVLTAADVPVNEYGLIVPDQPVLCGPGSTPTAAHVRWEADQIALVRSLTTTNGAHEPGRYIMRTGYSQRNTIVHPTVGPFVTKLLGKRGEVLPDSVVVGQATSNSGFLDPSLAPVPSADPSGGLPNAKLLTDADQCARRMQIASQLG